MGFVVRWKSKIGRRPPTLALTTDDQGHLGVTKPDSGLNQRVEHRLQVEGRPADDFQHVAGRGLVFERFL